MTDSSLLGHLDGWRCHAHTGDTREEYRLPRLPVPLVQPGQARPPSGPVYCLSQREMGTVPGADGEQRLRPARRSTAGPPIARRSTPAGPSGFKAPTAYAPGGRLRSSSASFLRRLGVRDLHPGRSCLPTLARSPETPRRNARIPPRCRLLNAAPTDLLLQGQATGITGRSRIAGGPRFTHPRCFQLPPAFPPTRSPPA